MSITERDYSREKERILNVLPIGKMVFFIFLRLEVIKIPDLAQKCLPSPGPQEELYTFRETR